MGKGKEGNGDVDDLEVRVGFNPFDLLSTLPHLPPLSFATEEGIQAAQLLIQQALDFCREQQLLNDELLLIGDAE